MANDFYSVFKKPGEPHMALGSETFECVFHEGYIKLFYIDLPPYHPMTGRFNNLKDAPTIYNTDYEPLGKLVAVKQDKDSTQKNPLYIVLVHLKDGSILKSRDDTYVTFVNTINPNEGYFILYNVSHRN